MDPWKEKIIGAYQKNFDAHLDHAKSFKRKK